MSVGDTPHFLLYSYDKILPYDLVVPSDSQEIIEMHEYVCENMERRKSILEIASSHLRASKEEQSYYRKKDAKRADRKPYVGQRVYIKETPSVGVKSKLTRKWKGPHRIKTVLPHNRLLVEEIKNNPKQHTVHLDHAKLLGEIEIDRKSVV